MSDSQNIHEFDPNDPKTVGTNDIVFDCPHCRKSLVVNRTTAGRATACPSCGKSIPLPEEHKVVTLAESAETKALQAKPAWEQEMVAIESALKESTHQRQEAGNFYKSHASEANRLKARIEKQAGNSDQEIRIQFKHQATEANRQKARIDKLDVKIKELEARRSAIRAAHS